MTRQFSAGGIVYKITDQTYWLIIKPRPSELFPTERYQLPKGHIEPGEKSEQASVREVMEETGITAKIIKKVGDNKYVIDMKDEKFFKISTYYLMEYVSGELTTNDEVSELFWLPFDEAKKKLSFSGDKKLLEKADELLRAGGPGSRSTS